MENQHSSPTLLVREIEVHAAGHAVPTVLWLPPAAARPCPLVLVGHGGSQHKTHPGIVELARRFVLGHGLAVAAIDGPIHGARRPDGKWGLEVQSEFARMWQRQTRVDAMVTDWRAAIDVLSRLEEVDAARIGWWGVSMGTAYGLPLIAADRRIGAALLGMWGSDYPNSGRLLENAPAVQCPVLFQVKWDDQFFTRQGQIVLFDHLGTPAKWLKSYPGAHTPVAGEQMEDGIAFLAARLVGG